MIRCCFIFLVLLIASLATIFFVFGEDIARCWDEFTSEVKEEIQEEVQDAKEELQEAKEELKDKLD